MISMGTLRAFREYTRDLRGGVGKDMDKCLMPLNNYLLNTTQNASCAPLRLLFSEVNYQHKISRILCWS